jgi:hypothetical protein
VENIMPRLRLDLDTETFDSLLAQASAELRPVQLQAKALLRQALGLPFPYPIRTDDPTCVSSEQPDRKDDGLIGQ